MCAPLIRCTNPTAEDPSLPEVSSIRMMDAGGSGSGSGGGSLTAL